ncbi:hypothetical protein SASPL_121734 [Salvia splendens]|uniref:Uncharacterized protein n=1 Tax=Salvia splendens TaxID=180675 RepID=A0A8X8XVJ6_SALSN|nr:hypothetical protein SASPL_121734 [Salvia splendens]
MKSQNPLIMSSALSTLFSKTPIKLSPSQISPRFHHSDTPFPPTYSPLTKKAKPLNKLQISHSFHGSFKKSINGFPLNKSGFSVKAQNEETDSDIRGESSMPEKFRYLTKEASDKPARWPFLTANRSKSTTKADLEAYEAPCFTSVEAFPLLPGILVMLLHLCKSEGKVIWVAVTASNSNFDVNITFTDGKCLDTDLLAFLLYSWRAVLWELTNWRKALGALTWFLGYVSKLALAFVSHFAGDPLTSTIRLAGTAFYSIRSFYSGVVAYAPIPDLTLIITLTSAVLAVAETASPDSVNSQLSLLTLAGLIGFAAVRSYVTELVFWTLLVGVFCFARFVKRRDYVSSALPLAAVLAAVGEPWVRIAAMGSYLALAVLHHAGNLGDDVRTRAIERVPTPLLLAALAIGVRVAARWAGSRHLTWMIV